MEPRSYSSIAEIKLANRGCDSPYWFSPDTMRFFGTVVGRSVVHGRYFVTGDRPDDSEPHLWSIRWARPNGQIETVGAFRAYRNEAEAMAAADTCPPLGFCCTRAADRWGLGEADLADLSPWRLGHSDGCTGGPER